MIFFCDADSRVLNRDRNVLLAIDLLNLHDDLDFTPLCEFECVWLQAEEHLHDPLDVGSDHAVELVLAWFLNAFILDVNKSSI